MPTTSSRKKVLILGATGPLGLLTVKEALLKDFEITLYVRNPQKLTDEIKENKNITARLPTLSSETLIVSNSTLRSS